MIDVSSVRVDSRDLIGVKVDLPGGPPFVMILAANGFVMCGFLNVEVAERLSVVAAVVSGVKSFEDVLDGEVRAVTSRAKALGVVIGMKGSEALKHML